MSKIQKTNVARLLDKRKTDYQLISYRWDENDLSAIHAASQLNEDPGRVFKTLLLEGDKTKYFVCIVPGDSEVDLKKAASASGNKSCALIPVKDLLSVTGYIRGACSPIGMKRQYPAYIYSSCLGYGSIYVSAGQRGLQVKINPRDLITAVAAEVAELV